MFDPFTSYTIAQEIAHLIINITGDRTRVAKIVEFRSHPRWRVERYTGSDWVEG